MSLLKQWRVAGYQAIPSEPNIELEGSEPHYKIKRVCGGGRESSQKKGTDVNTLRTRLAGSYPTTLMTTMVYRRKYYMTSPKKTNKY